MPSLTPVHIPATSGTRYDFSTHANDFLVEREAAQATEVFTTCVPGGGSVPAHVHDDMEQVFVFVAGTGTAILTRDDTEYCFPCRPGDVLFVPCGWQHRVFAAAADGVRYVTVNAFTGQSARAGDTAIGHARIVDAGFDRATAVASAPGAVDVARCAEAWFRPGPDGARVWPDSTPLDATLTRQPGTYRVLRCGPFEYVTPVIPVPRIVDAALADELHQLTGNLPVYVEGSQSPLSAKPPNGRSDIDILVAVTAAGDLPDARETARLLCQFARRRGLPLDPGVIHVGWLELPGFYSAVNLDPRSGDRRWFTAGEEQRLEEANRRQQAAMSRLEHPGQIADLLAQSLTVAGITDEVQGWRITPRWRGLQ